MKKIFLSALIIFSSLIYVGGQVVRLDSLNFAPFGKVYTYTTGTVSPQNLIIMISGDGGWKYGVTDFSREFSRMNSLVEMITKFQSDQPEKFLIPQIENIPTIITRGKGGEDHKIIAILFSGDGGWYGLEQSIANHLSDSGISTLGIDTRKYFWNRKSPETTASDIANLLSYYGKEWNISQFMLIGYSQGAEIIPFVLTRLPEALKSRVISSVMLSPEITTDFEVHFTNMLGIGNRQNKYDVIAEVVGIQKTRQICIFGEKEKTNVPELLKNTKVETVFIPGDHHYKSNSALIVQVMKNKNAF